ncbi:MAG: leucine-rich repeat domain-containing protein [Clostridiales bacterium]|nr:leucine-rich repeat domain-containing protein [Clostridiales bacterium]
MLYQKPAKVVFFNSSNKNIKSLEGIKDWDFIHEVEISDDNHELQANLEPLCQLKNLEVLTVFNADGRKLEEIKNCINLKRIKITRSVNDISFMQKMKQVEELDLSHNPKLSNISALENMTKMKKLVLSDTNVSDISVVKNMKELEVLDIQGTKVEDISVLRELSHLKKVLIYDVPIKELSFLDQLSALEVDVEKAKVGDVSTFEYKRRPEWLYSDIYNQYMNEEEKKAARQLMSENGVTDFGKIEYILGLHNTKPAIVLFSTDSNKNIKSLEGIKDWDFIREVEIWDDDHELQVNLEPLCHLKNLEVFIAENIAERKLERIENCINLKKIKIEWSVNDISFIRKMEQVEELDLSNNPELSDISMIKNMTKVKKLVLSNTNISDITVVKNMKELEILEIESTKVEDISPLRELSHLKKILMYDTPVRDISLLASLPVLEYVDVKKTNVEDVSAFEQAGKLEIFYHYKENYDEEMFRAIQQLMKDNGLSLVTDFYKISRIFAWSETIILEGDQAKNIKTLACIKDWDFIKCVIIEGNELRASLEPLCYLKNLERLTVRKFDGERLKAIENCINLKEICLKETSVKDISFLRKMEQVEELKLIDNPGISDINVVANMKNLKELNISGTQVTDISPLKGLSHLKMVWMYGTPIKNISVLAELPEIEDINALKTKVEDVSAFIKAGKLKILGIEKSKLPKPVKKIFQGRLAD